MTKEEQRIAIAKVCGWKQNDYPHKMAENMWYHPNITEESYVDTEDLLDYVNDLNAMHEAEKFMLDEQKLIYTAHLHPKHVHNYKEADYLAMTATAEVRAEAFLRVLNLWKD